MISFNFLKLDPITHFKMFCVDIIIYVVAVMSVFWSSSPTWSGTNAGWCIVDPFLAGYFCHVVCRVYFCHVVGTRASFNSTDRGQEISSRNIKVLNWVLYKHIYEQILTFSGANVEGCDKGLFLESLEFVNCDAFLNILSKDDNIGSASKCWLTRRSFVCSDKMT